ncbi:hypothetical protein HBA94_16040 [Ochrobactrum sp. GRS2]|nr:hypothetical protein [Ochrobactrum sp. GRS2]
MARVRFTEDFDYKPTKQTTVAYRAGMEITVKQDCADRAVALGMAVLLDQSKSVAKPDDKD